ncbi:MAG: hypothetical protein MZV70_37340 [Desulfobacterales bacterium]|nr:hypothetical protein [Desulfobacterales bacterium]
MDAEFFGGLVLVAVVLVVMGILVLVEPCPGGALPPRGDPAMAPAVPRVRAVSSREASTPRTGRDAARRGTRALPRTQPLPPHHDGRRHDDRRRRGHRHGAVGRPGGPRRHAGRLRAGRAGGAVHGDGVRRDELRGAEGGRHLQLRPDRASAGPRGSPRAGWRGSPPPWRAASTRSSSRSTRSSSWRASACSAGCRSATYWSVRLVAVACTAGFALINYRGVASDRARPRACSPWGRP